MNMTVHATSGEAIELLHANPKWVYSFLRGEDAPVFALREPGVIGQFFGFRHSEPETRALPIGLIRAPNFSLDLDRSWVGIHFLLSGSGNVREPETMPASMVRWLAFGGKALPRSEPHSPKARSITPEDTRRWAESLSALNEDALWLRYDPAAMKRYGIYSDMYADLAADNEAWFYTLDNFLEFQKFVVLHAGAGLGLILETR